MPADTRVVTPDVSPVSPTDDVTPEPGPGDRTGAPEIGAGDGTVFLAPEVPAATVPSPMSPHGSLTMDTDHEATEVAAEDDDVGSVEDHEVQPDPLPPPLALPPWLG
eukprot:1333542-Heterocapsa_arctica.AAC.1